MEWILWAALAVMLALLCYTIFWTSIVIRKKVQPVMDSFFDAFELFVRSKAKTHENRSGKSQPIRDPARSSQ